MYSVTVDEASSEGINLVVRRSENILLELYVRDNKSPGSTEKNLSVFVRDDQNVKWITPREF